MNTQTEEPVAGMATYHEAANRPQQTNVAFLTMLQQHRGGETLSDLSEQLAKVTEAVFHLSKAGTLTLKLTIKPATRTPGAMVVEDEIKSSLPKPDDRSSIFFADTESWCLLRDNPNQLALGLRTVDGMVTGANAE